MTTTTTTTTGTAIRRARWNLLPVLLGGAIAWVWAGVWATIGVGWGCWSELTLLVGAAARTIRKGRPWWASPGGDDGRRAIASGTGLRGSQSDPAGRGTDA